MDMGQLVSAWKDFASHGAATWVALGSLLFIVTQVIGFVGHLTPWTWDDNLGILLGKLVSKLWKK